MNNQPISGQSKQSTQITLAFKVPYTFSSNDTINNILNQQVIQSAIQKEQSIKIGHEGFIQLTKKKTHRPLYELKVVKYRNKETGQMIKKIQGSKQVKIEYDYNKLTDFHRFIYAKQRKPEQYQKLMKQKILLGRSSYPQQFYVSPINFLKPYHISILSSDLLSNKIKNSDKDFIKSKQIGYGDDIPSPPSQIPEYIQNSKIFTTLKQYFERRPCWLRNVLAYQLKQDGFKGKFTINQLKNVLKFFSYTFKDGPWKHVFCRYNFNPLQKIQAAMFQSVTVKIKQKQIDDYQQHSQQNDDSDNVYDPTLRQIPSKFMKLYQLVDIDDQKIQEIVQNSIITNTQCSKQNGWIIKRDFMQINMILKKIRDQRSK